MKYWSEAGAPKDQLSRAHSGDAGYDLRTSETFSLARASSRLVGTGLHVAIPEGCVGIVKSRSGLAAGSGIEAGAGVIDSGYRGEVRVLLHNLGESSVDFRRGDRIAQLVVLRLCGDTPVRAERLEDLESSDRGSDGFGSTGL